jgi:hypothetical protein
MHIKKIISLTTVLIIVTSVLFSSTAFGENAVQEKTILMQAAGEMPVKDAISEKATKITRDKAVAIAKTLLDDAGLYDTSNISLNPNYSSKGTSWSINFYKKLSPGGNVSVNVDSESGEIISFYIWDGNNGQQNYIAKYTRAEAKLKAESYIVNQLKQDINSFEPQKDDLNFYNNFYGGVKQQIVYNYIYSKKVNGIPFTTDSINIGVDGTTGKITSFNKNSLALEPSKFPKVENIISAASALSKYKDSANVILQYISTYEPKPYGMSTPKIRLAYVPSSYINILDAFSGKPINYDGSLANTDAAAFTKLAENPVAMKPDSKLQSKAITEAQATEISEVYKKLIEDLLKIKFDQNNNNSMSIAAVSGVSGQNNIWNYGWNKFNGNSSINFNMGINGDTGYISNINVGNYDNSSRIYADSQQVVKEKYNWQKSKEKAMEIIKKLLPEQYGFYVDENITQPELNADSLKYLKEYNFNFTRIVNGIRFRDNNMNISIDRETGEVKNFYFNWTDIEFPAITSVISKEVAPKTYFTGSTANLSYILQTTYNKTGIPIIGDAPKLVYTFTNSQYPTNYGLILDAVTGKFVDYSGNEVKIPTPNEELNLTENWAKRSVELLASQGILKKSNIDYNAGVTRFEATKMLSLAKGMNNFDPRTVITLAFSDVIKTNDFYLYIENAVKQKIINESKGEFKGNEIISKSEFAKLLINLIGYSDIAKFTEIFKVNSMTNVPDELVGYVAICKALDILPVAPGEAFDGSKPVTYAEAATALYKALTFIK